MVCINSRSAGGRKIDSMFSPSMFLWSLIVWGITNLWPYPAWVGNISSDYGLSITLSMQWSTWMYCLVIIVMDRCIINRYQMTEKKPNKFGVKHRLDILLASISKKYAIEQKTCAEYIIGLWFTFICDKENTKSTNAYFIFDIMG